MVILLSFGFTTCYLLTHKNTNRSSEVSGYVEDGRTTAAPRDPACENRYAAGVPVGPGPGASRQRTVCRLFAE